MRRNTTMKDIADLLEREGWRITGYIYDEDTFYSHLYAMRNEIVLSLTAPHSGNGFSYLLRADYAASHDRWSNAAYEQVFKEDSALMLEILLTEWPERLDRR